MFIKWLDWLEYVVKYCYEDDLKRINNIVYNSVVFLFYYYGYGK